MIDRRLFLQGAGMTALCGSLAFAKEEMPARKIPSSGESLPIVGFGNSQAFRDNDYETSRKLLDILRDKGGRFVDIHGASQEALGRYMHEHEAHNELFVGTNLYTGENTTAEQSISLSQEIQGKDPLDLLFLPRPTEIDSQWPSMIGWKEQGLARHIGVAATGQRFFDMMTTLVGSGTIDVIQINYSLLEPEAGERLLPLAADNGVAVVVNRPFTNGNYFGAVGGHPLPDWAADFDCASWAQFSLKFILAHPAVTCVITETSKTHHAIDNLSAGFGGLPDPAMQQRMLGHIREIATLAAL